MLQGQLSWNARLIASSPIRNTVQKVQHQAPFDSVEIDECLSMPCINGDCKDGLNEFSCVCYPGFYGTRCENNFNECLSNPCRKGVCNEDPMKPVYTCTCEAGWTGKYCEKNIDDCKAQCLNGATCVDTIGIRGGDTGPFLRQIEFWDPRFQQLQGARPQVIFWKLLEIVKLATLKIWLGV